MFWKRTLTPAPNTPPSVITKLSGNSVPRITTLSKPLPPSTETGALMLYWTVSLPSPGRTFIWPAVDTSLVSSGWATPLASSRIWPLPSTCASAKARTMNRSSPASPSRRNSALLL